MPPKALIESWKKTTAYLIDARSHLSEAAEGICADEIHEFQEYLEHNELELALDALEKAYKKSGMEGLKVVELLALAAANMGLSDRVRGFDEYLSKAGGVPYVTKLL
jgi:hypothetical protein